MKRVYTLPFGVKPVLPRDLAVLAFRAPGIVALGDVGTDGLVRTICVDRDVPDVTFESRVYVEDVHVGAVYATTGTRVHVALRGVSTKHPDMWGWSRGEWDVATGEPL